MKWKFLIYTDDAGYAQLPADLKVSCGDVFSFVGTNDCSLALRLAEYNAYRVVDVAAGTELASKYNAEGHRVQWAINEIEFKS